MVICPTSLMSVELFKETTMDAELRAAHQKMSFLQLVESFRNAIITCRLRGVSRTRFYEYKRRFQTHGIEGLKDLALHTQI